VHLYDLPLVFALIGLALYTVLGGADFGAGIWQLTAGTGPGAKRIREHAHRSMALVWEANHVWLIFVLTVFWTAYPIAFGSIASTLSVPLLLAAIGIILRGAAYALRSGAGSARELSRIDALFAIASLLTPFALGAAVGGIAAGRVPVGNAAGHLFTSWTGPVSILIGTLAVVNCAYLAGVYLAADAARLGDRQLERAFRARALLAGVVAGALAVAGLVVLHSDAHRLYHGLVNGSGLPTLIVSLVAGVLALGFVLIGRYEAARYSAALAVAAILAGWALAQKPTILPGLTIQHAAAPHDTLVLLVVVVLGGGAILFPSLVLLFRLRLRAQVDPAAVHEAPLAPSARGLARASASGFVARSAGACLISGFGLLTIADAAWTHAIGVVCLLAFVVLGFAAIRPTAIAAIDQDEPECD
jgi:cytochrome d ubiquinol oxidase subunit II